MIVPPVIELYPDILLNKGKFKSRIDEINLKKT